MQKRFFILAATLIIVLLTALWAYLFLNGNPDMSDDIFSEFGEEGGNLPPLINNEPGAATTTINLERPKLRQLTTKPVAGFAEVVHSTSTPVYIYYAEKGTGHIFSIDLTTGTETRLSATTFPIADKAKFSPDGKYVAITTHSNQKERDLAFGLISTSSNSVNLLLEERVLDFGVSDDGYALFTVAGSQGAVGFALNPDTKERTNLFSLPFFEATVRWGKKLTDPIYLYPKPSFLLESYLYEASEGTLNRLPAGGFGFTASVNDSMLVFSARGNNGPTGYIYDRQNKSSKLMQAPVYPEKCALGDAGYIFYCAHESITPPYEYPDNWYKGIKQYKDGIYRLAGDTMNGELLVDTFVESGRELDIIDMSLGQTSSALYFINKNDQTLWMYEL